MDIVVSIWHIIEVLATLILNVHGRLLLVENVSCSSQRGCIHLWETHKKRPKKACPRGVQATPTLMVANPHMQCTEHVVSVTQIMQP